MSMQYHISRCGCGELMELKDIVYRMDGYDVHKYKCPKCNIEIQVEFKVLKFDIINDTISKYTISYNVF